MGHQVEIVVPVDDLRRPASPRRVSDAQGRGAQGEAGQKVWGFPNLGSARCPSPTVYGFCRNVSTEAKADG